MSEPPRPELGRYCVLCRNSPVEIVDARNPHCRACDHWVLGPLSEAWRRYKQLQEEETQCCGGISSDIAFQGRPGAPAVVDPYLYFHGKWWETNYYPGSEFQGSSWSGEYGVQLHRDRAETYLVIDQGESTEGVLYGEAIPYRDPEFEAKLAKQLEGAGEAAWNLDWRTCGACGSHYHLMAQSHCSCDGEPDGESEAEREEEATDGG